MFYHINYQRYLISILLLVIIFISNTNQEKFVSSSSVKYSPAANDDDDGFVPMTHMSYNAKTYANNNNNRMDIKRSTTTTDMKQTNQLNDGEANEQRSINIRLKDLQNLLGQLIADEKIKMDDLAVENSGGDRRAITTNLLFNEKFIERVKNFAERYIFQDRASTGVASQTGRLFLFKGFKKLMWPVFIGIQVAKTVLLAMFLPSIIGSIGKMVGKGLVSVSGIGHPSETIDDFDFKENAPVDDQTNGMGYNYPHQTMTANQNNAGTNVYDAAPAANNPFSMYDMGDQKLQYGTNTFNLQDYAQSRKEMVQSKKDDFKVFHDIPASSMLLTNYDPFYSPLLSRLDSVFQQLNLHDDNETCREKLVCLMYATPAKYMPYSNLVSAQLSRELNELRKPTSDNVEILRFFKYMRAARDGQDGQNCNSVYKKCSTNTDSDQPAMLTTYNDINKLVQARKF